MTDAPRPPVQIPLHHLFAHNSWATLRLLAFCERLPPEQIHATAPGAVGSTFETLHHVVQAECGYLARLAPALKPTEWQPYLDKTLEAVKTRAVTLAGLWDTYAATDPDAETPCRPRWPDGRVSEYPAGMEIVQALHHSTAHREQICTILTTLGLEPPDTQGIAWGVELGMIRRLE